MKSLLFFFCLVAQLTSYSQNDLFKSTWVCGDDNTIQIYVLGNGAKVSLYDKVSNQVVQSYGDMDADGTIEFGELTSDKEYQLIISGNTVGFNIGPRAELIRSVDQWGTVKLTSWETLFSGAINLTISDQAGEPDLSLISGLNGAFSGCTSLTRGCANWDVSNVAFFEQTFKGCTSFEDDLSGWITSSAQSFNETFYNSGININFSDWDFSSTIDITDFVGGGSLSVENYDILLQKLVDAPSIGDDQSFVATGLKYCFGESARKSLIDDRGWAFSGDAINEASQSLELFDESINVCGRVIVLYPNSLDSVSIVQGVLSGKGLKKYALGADDSLVYRATTEESSNSPITIGARAFSPQGYCQYAYDEVSVTIKQIPTVDAGNGYSSVNGAEVELAGQSNASNVTWEASGQGGFESVNSLSAKFLPANDDVDAGMVKLTLTADENGCEASDDVLVVLKACDITVNTEIVGNKVVLTAINQNPKQLMSHTWVFGDSHNGRGLTVEHVYGEAGSYDATVTSISEDGFCSKTKIIELVITETPITLSKISGTVYVDQNVLDQGTVGIFYLAPNGNYELKQEVILNNASNGFFEFDALSNKNYYLGAQAGLASTVFASTRPTFYGDVVDWSGALPVNPGDQTTGYDISLFSYALPVGSTFDQGDDAVRGNVTFEEDEKKTGGSRDIVDNPLPVQNAVVLLYDEAGNLLTFTTTDEFGDFSFTSLEAGIYDLRIEYLGTSILVSQTIIIDGDGSTIDEFAFKLDQTAVGDNPNAVINNSEKLSQVVYPNPTSGMLYVLGQNKYYSIYNSLGKKISEGDIINDKVDLSKLPAGIYLLELTVGGDVRIEKIVKK